VLTFRGVDHPWPIYSLAAIGAAAGAGLAIAIESDLAGVRPGVVAAFAAGGTGVGALVGMALCR
jgi:hypothetical protein